MRYIGISLYFYSHFVITSTYYVSPYYQWSNSTSILSTYHNLSVFSSGWYIKYQSLYKTYFYIVVPTFFFNDMWHLDALHSYWQSWNKIEAPITFVQVYCSIGKMCHIVYVVWMRIYSSMLCLAHWHVTISRLLVLHEKYIYGNACLEE